MKKLITTIENAAIRRYGFENHKTIAAFRVTEILRHTCNYWN